MQATLGSVCYRRSMHWASGMTAGMLGAALWVAPQIASACSCTPGFELTWPGARASVPEGSRLLVQPFCGAEATLVSDVRVDGEHVMLVDAPAYGLTGIEPPPTVGQEVHARFCVDEDNQQCDEVSFLIAERVPVTLEAPGLALEHQWQRSVCGWDWEWSVRIVLEGREANAGRPVVYALELGGSLDVRSAVAPDGSHAIDQNVGASELPEPGQEMCVTVRTHDVWGATAQPTTACIEVEPAPEVDCADPQDDPRTCPSDPPSADSSGSSSTGDSEMTPGEEASSTTGESAGSGAEAGAYDDSTGGGCRSAQPPHPWWLVLLGGLRRRRKPAFTS